jgi:hypothetical protein
MGLVLAACGTRGDEGVTKAREGKGADSTATRSLSWALSAPPSWDDRVVMVDDPEGIERLRAQGIHSARLFNYLPYDTTIAPQTLLGVYVYDSTAWARLEAEGGPPQGEPVRRSPGIVYIASFPQSNPFADGARDASEFSRRGVDRAFVDTAFRVVR